MSENNVNFKYFGKDEYEVNLYGFTLNDFKRENHLFLRKLIKKSASFIQSTFIDFIQDPEIISQIGKSIENTEKEVFESCKHNIDKIVNVEVERCLTIPENVILPHDKSHAIGLPMNDVLELKKEVYELMKISDQNIMFLKFLNTEINSYSPENDLEYLLIQKAENLLSNESFSIKMLCEALEKLKDSDQ